MKKQTLSILCALSLISLSSCEEAASTDAPSLPQPPSKPAFEKVKTNLTGKQYLMQQNDYALFHYDREYSEASNEFITTYKNYNPNSGKPLHKITVRHEMQTDSIIVQVKALWGGVFVPNDIYYRLKASSEFKNGKPFGISGFAKAMGGNNYPHDVLFEFLNSDYTYVNLLEVCTRDGSDAEWYVLNN